MENKGKELNNEIFKCKEIDGIIAESTKNGIADSLSRIRLIQGGIEWFKQVIGLWKVPRYSEIQSGGDLEPGEGAGGFERFVTQPA